MMSLRPNPVGYLALTVLAAACSDAPNRGPATEGASVGEPAQADSRALRAPAASLGAAPAVKADFQPQEAWRKTMARKPMPKAGCFRASYPSTTWEEVACAPKSEPAPLLPARLPTLASEASGQAAFEPDLSGSFDQQVAPSVARSRPGALEAEAAPVVPSPVSAGASPFFLGGTVSAGASPFVVGGTNTDDWTASTSGGISFVEGLFPLANFAQDQSTVTNFTFQINTNHFGAPQCCGTNCGFQQFVYNGIPNGSLPPPYGPSAFLVIQYWLLSICGGGCPDSSWTQTTYDNGPACYKDGNKISFCNVGGCAGNPQALPLSDLQQISFSAETNPSLNQQGVVASDGSYAWGTADLDGNTLSLNGGTDPEEWTTAEFNVFGLNPANLQINGNADIVVQADTSQDPSVPPFSNTGPATCLAQSLTFESNSLNLVAGACCGFQGGIRFSESNYSAPMYACPPLDGVAASQRFGVSNETDAYAVDTNGQLAVTSKVGSGNWSSAEVKTPTLPVGAPLAVSQRFGVTNQTDVYAITIGGYFLVASIVEPNGSWGSSSYFQGQFSPNTPLAATNQRGISNQTDVFGVDYHGNLDVMWVQGTGQWNLTTAIATGFPEGANLAASPRFGGNNETDVFAIDNNGALTVTSIIGSGSWTSSEQSPQHLFPPGAPVAVSLRTTPNGGLPPKSWTYAFAVDVAGNLDVLFAQGANSWTFTQAVATGFPIGAPLAASTVAGVADETAAFAIDTNGAMRWTSININGSWNSADETPQHVFSPGTQVAASLQVGTSNITDVFAVDVNGQMENNWVASPGPWSNSPIDTTFAFPTPGTMGTCIASGGSCINNSQCCSNVCNGTCQ